MISSKVSLHPSSVWGSSGSSGFSSVFSGGSGSGIS